MANKAKYPVSSNVQGVLHVSGSFVPNGTSNPTVYKMLGKGAVTIAYVTTGTWTVTLNDNVYDIVAYGASLNDTEAATVYHDVNTTASGQVLTITHTRAADLSAANKALSNTCAQISFWLDAQLSSIPGDGI